MFPQKNNKGFFLLLASLLIVNITFAQLSDLHYLPPLKQGGNNQAIKQQSVYLSTPETLAFTVNIYQGTNPTPITSLSLSNSSPVTYSLANGDNNITLVTNTNTGIVLTNSGLRLEAPGGQSFYVNYRGRSNSQATSLTSKGRAALGTQFKWGGPPNYGTHSSMSSVLGIMATTDNTVVDIYGYDTNCEFRLQNDPDGITSNMIQIILDAGETYVLEAKESEVSANNDGWLGATITADKDIAISNGGLNFGVNPSSASRDAGIDQPVPEDKLGKDYIFIRGNGGSTNEYPLIIATQDNTDIFINGSGTAIVTLNNGEYYQVPAADYSGSSVGANMLVQTSKNAYAYQVVSGSTGIHTVGLNFIAPVNCLLPDIMNHIPDIRNIAGITATGGITLIASTSTPDSDIIITDNSGVVSKPSPLAVAGTSDWKTFYISGLNGDVSVQSTGPIAVGFLGFNGARGIAGYFSGFDTVPDVNLEITGNNCFPGSTLEIIDDDFEAYQWYKNNSSIVGATTNILTPSGPGDYYVEVTKGPCTYDSNILHLNTCNVITNRRITLRVKN